MEEWAGSSFQSEVEHDLEQAIEHYAKALHAIEHCTEQPPLEVLLDLLTARDRVQDALSTTPTPPQQLLVRLIQLDNQLRELTRVICRGDRLAQCCQSLKPSESSWWWYLDSDAASSLITQPRWMRFNWVWNLGTVVCLVFSTAFISQTAKAFSTKGFDFLGTLSTVGQGAGLAVVAGGALTDRGKRTVETVLASLEIPQSLYPKVTFGIAASLLTVSYGIHTNLRLISDWYYHKGERQVDDNAWLQAQDSYIRSLNFDPSDRQSLLSLGELYENMGDFERAIAEYEKGLLSGEPEFLNAVGRARLMRSLEENGWEIPINQQAISQVVALLQRAARHPDSQHNPPLLADVHTNAGIAGWAAVDFEAALSENANRVLNEVFLSFRGATEQEGTLPTASADIEAWRQSRGQCYLQLARLVNYLLKVSYDDPFFNGSKLIYQGLDPRRYKDDPFACIEIERGDHPGATSDIQLMNVVKNSTPIALALQEINSNFLQPELTDARLLNTLQQRLYDQIQRTWQLLDLEKPLIMRVLVNADAQVMQYYVYDPDSRGLALLTPIYDLWAANQGRLADEPVADFEVVFSSDVAIAITPWYAAYKVDTPPIANAALLRSPPPPSDLQTIDAAEMAVLQELLWLQIWNVTSDLPEDAYALFDKPLVYRVSVNADGTIASYQPADELSRQNLENTLLSGVAIATPPNQAQVDFRVEFKAGDAFEVLPWDEMPPN
jgi:tetratricopeptide (TPR) repeat protein